MRSVPYGVEIREGKRPQQEQLPPHSSHPRHHGSLPCYFGLILLRWTQKHLPAIQINKRIFTLSVVMICGQISPNVSSTYSFLVPLRGLLESQWDLCLLWSRMNWIRSPSDWGVVALVTYLPTCLIQVLTWSRRRTVTMVRLEDNRLVILVIPVNTQRMLVMD